MFLLKVFSTRKFSGIAVDILKVSKKNEKVEINVCSLTKNVSLFFFSFACF